MNVKIINLWTGKKVGSSRSLIFWGKSYWLGKDRSYQNDSARAWCECSNECEPKNYSAYDIYVNKNWDTIMEEQSETPVNCVGSWGNWSDCSEKWRWYTN